MLLLEQERSQWLAAVGQAEVPAWSEVQADFDTNLAAGPDRQLMLLESLGVA